jgi:uncharacterized protein YlaI
VLDLAADPVVEEIICLKGAQIGWSEVCRNIFGFWVDLDPGPTMILMPDQKSAEDFKTERIDPLIKSTEAVRRHLTSRAHDDTKHRVIFDTMSVYFVWAGSKSGTKSRPIRRLICEEPDEYPPFSSTGGDPLSKAEKRLTTYRDKGRAKLLIGGTPTTRLGNTWKRWELCAVRYHFWLPCPHCNGYQLLQWKQVKWPKAEAGEERAAHAERVKSVGVAHYECEHCKGRIDDHHKPRMLRRGVWANEDQVVTQDGRVVGPHRVAKRVGVKVGGLYSPWVLFGQLASEWLEAQGDPNSLADFINQRLAETFEEERAKTEPDQILGRANGAPAPLIVPAWTRRLIATADTQGESEQDGHFWYVIRAWGYDWRSQLVDFGVCHSKQDLHERIFGRPLPVDGVNVHVVPEILVVDAGGHRWNEVCDFAKTNPRIHAAHGSAHVRTFMVDEKPYKKHGIVLWEIDTEKSKDQLHLLIHDPNKNRWQVNSAVNDDYARQVCAERKILDPTKNRAVWTVFPKGTANHLGDCEQEQVAVAWRLGCGIPEPAKTPEQAQQADDSQRPGWMPPAPNNWMRRR